MASNPASAKFKTEMIDITADVRHKLKALRTLEKGFSVVFVRRGMRSASVGMYPKVTNTKIVVI